MLLPRLSSWLSEVCVCVHTCVHACACVCTCVCAPCVHGHVCVCVCETDRGLGLSTNVLLGHLNRQIWASLLSLREVGQPWSCVLVIRSGHGGLEGWATISRILFRPVKGPVPFLANSRTAPQHLWRPGRKRSPLLPGRMAVDGVQGQGQGQGRTNSSPLGR